LSEKTLSLGAGSLELGLPLVIAFMFWRIPQWRTKLIVMLGALTPAILIYASLLAAHFSETDNLGGRWAFYAVWEMSFVPYLAALSAGLAISFSSQPRSSVARYAIGILSAPLAVIVLMILVNVTSRL